MWWQIRWAKNAVFGLLPFPNAMRQLKRQLRSYPVDIPEWTLEEGLRLLRMLRQTGCPIKDACVVEVGSGWRPIIPLLFSLSGAAKIVMIDVQRLMDGATFAGTVKNLERCAPRIAVELGLEEGEVRTLLTAQETDLTGLLRRFRMEYHAPCDLISSPLPDGKFDVVASRAVLEHVPPDILRLLLGRVYRLLQPGGWTCHAVDNSDHWSHKDRRLSRVNFLRYSDRFFGFLNWFNPLDYQNRLRHPEYVEILRETGFEILLAQSEPEPKALEALQTLPIAARFRGISAEDLTRLDSYFLARRPTGNAAPVEPSAAVAPGLPSA
jgi:SAM-dependent methyltransferase